MSRKILVVDDNEDILDAIGLVLESEGYEIKTTLQGEEALKIVSEFNPDLILLDVLLSGSDGREIANRLKSDKKTSKIPVIMISAHPDAQSSVKEVGVADFISKPFDTGKLLKMIKKHTA